MNFRKLCGFALGASFFLSVIAFDCQASSRSVDRDEDLVMDNLRGISQFEKNMIKLRKKRDANINLNYQRFNHTRNGGFDKRNEKNFSDPKALSRLGNIYREFLDASEKSTINANGRVYRYKVVSITNPGSPLTMSSYLELLWGGIQERNSIINGLTKYNPLENSEKVQDPKTLNKITQDVNSKVQNIQQYRWYSYCQPTKHPKEIEQFVQEKKDFVPIIYSASRVLTVGSMMMCMMLEIDARDNFISTHQNSYMQRGNEEGESDDPKKDKSNESDSD